MRSLALTVVGAALFVGGCGSAPDPWTAYQSHSAGATAGVRTLVSSLYGVDEACAPLPLPAVAVSQTPKLGTVTVEQTVASVVDPGGECDGRSVPAAGVFYEAPAGTVGTDQLTFVEQVEGGRPDRAHTVFIRVR